MVSIMSNGNFSVRLPIVVLVVLIGLLTIIYTNYNHGPIITKMTVPMTTGFAILKCDPRDASLIRKVEPGTRDLFSNMLLTLSRRRGGALIKEDTFWKIPINSPAFSLGNLSKIPTQREEELAGDAGRGVPDTFIPSSFILARQDVKSKSEGLTMLNYKPINITSGMNLIQKHDALISLAQQPQVICHKWEMYGNKGDGGWPVCLAPKLLPKTPCVVYSYGIKYDWSFDDAYHKNHLCTLRTFDPSMGKTKEHEHSKDVFFYPLGLSDKKETTNGGWKMHSHKQLLQRFKEENVILPYLKFDIESSEFQVLHNMIKDGVLKNVMQLSFEIHVKNPIYGGGADANVKNMFDAVKGLEALGFRRWFYHHRLNGFPFQCDQSFININFL